MGKIKVMLDYDRSEPHPYCVHGPTLLFRDNSQDASTHENEEEKYFFACAAFRERRDCNFKVHEQDLTTSILKKRYHLPIDEYKERRQKFLHKAANEQRHYCRSCEVPVLDAELPTHAAHNLIRNLSEEALKMPTKFLTPLAHDEAQAQYFFDDASLKFFLKTFQQLGITKVVCMGAPRLHEYMRSSNENIKSFLLDIDHRFFYFWDDANFAWHNMCNNYFFDTAQAAEFLRFLNNKGNTNERLLIFTDPPFACLTPIITKTLRELKYLYNSINCLKNQPVPIFWIYPYFNEHYIRKDMPEMEMCDYRVNYVNHTAYQADRSAKGARKYGSPVRFFTNVPLELIPLPVQEEYKYCEHCRRYTDLANKHCAKCETCPSKNGQTYRHCDGCGLCVKPNYVHCKICRRCTQIERHNCEEYMMNQRCWICRRVGHIELECKDWLWHSRHRVMRESNSHKKMNPVIVCLLCGHLGHNELKCKERSKYIEESNMFGSWDVKFK